MPQPSSPKTLKIDATTRPIKPMGAYQIQTLPGADKPFTHPNPNPLTRLMAYRRPKVRAAVRNQKRILRGHDAPLPAQSTPIKGRKTTVIGLTEMESVTSTRPRTTRRVAQ